MSFLSIISEQRPRMDVPKGKKGKRYHQQMGRADYSSVNLRAIQELRAKSIVAEKAYNDEVWTDEDIDTFLLDESLNTRNRVKFGFNMIKPIVEQYRGGAIQTEFSASVQPVTKHTATVRQLAMQDQMLMHSLAEMSPEMRRIISSRYNIGDSMQETLGMHEASWTDQNTKAMNHLLQQQAAINEMDRMNGEDAYRFATSGVLAEIYRKVGSHPRWEKIHPRDFFYDTSAQLPDFSDAAFLGSYQEMGMPRIAELWDVTEAQMRDIESSIKNYGRFDSGYYGSAGHSFNILNQTKVPVLSDYWIDQAFCEFGYVNGEGGVPTLVPIGYSEVEGDEPKYTKNDCIEPPTKKEAELFNGERTRKSFVQCTRFVEMVLWEDMAGTSITESKIGREMYNQGDLPDLVLDYGVYDLQEYNPRDVDRSENPIKATAYAIANGVIVSPVQAIIDPNRFVNRTFSAIEGQMNMSGGKGALIDMDMVDKLSIDQVESRKKQGKTIPVRTGGRGAAGAIQMYDDSPGTGAYSMLQVVASIQDLVRTVTGIHAPMMGEGQKDAMVGVTEILVARGATMQEPFFNAWADLQRRKYKCMATAGKEFYLDHPDVLADLVSAEDLLHLYKSRYFQMERYNAHVVRDNPERMRRKAANDWLDMLIQLGLIDRTFYAEYWNNSFVEDISPALKQYTAELQQAENAQRKEEAKQNMLAGLAAQEAQLNEQERELDNRQLDTADMIAKEGAKEKANITREEVKGGIKKEQMQDEAALSLR